MRFSRLLLIAAAALPLGACMTAEQVASAIAANDDAACQCAGAQPGTTAYAKCREEKSSQRGMAQNQQATQSFMRPRI